jgi:hypothetical protein
VAVDVDVDDVCGRHFRPLNMSIPSELCCPLSRELMQDPVRAGDNLVYGELHVAIAILASALTSRLFAFPDRQNVEAWIREEGSARASYFYPRCMLNLANLQPDTALLVQIRQYIMTVAEDGFNPLPTLTLMSLLLDHATTTDERCLGFSTSTSNATPRASTSWNRHQHKPICSRHASSCRS